MIVVVQRSLIIVQIVLSDFRSNLQTSSPSLGCLNTSLDYLLQQGVIQAFDQMGVFEITTEKFRLLDHLLSSRSRIEVAFGIRRHGFVVSRRRRLRNLTRSEVRIELILIAR